MNKQSSGLRFESREIAVILSLFIMVSLLMFTVGIVVGKGLAQAKFEGSAPVVTAHADSHERSPTSEVHAEPHHPPSMGTSVSANPPIEHPVTPEPPAPTKKEEILTMEEEEPAKSWEPLELKPKKAGSLDVHADLQADLESPETLKVLKNPKLKELFDTETEPSPKKALVVRKTKTSEDLIEGDFNQSQDSRSVASLTEKKPLSFSSGPYSVQIAAYSDEAQAKERVETLKTLGFAHAYFSAINLGENKETWFRVWLGHYPSFESAKRGGEALQARGEVKNFLVRKSESSRP